VACSGPQDLDLTVLRERRERAYREARVPARVHRRGGSGSNSGGLWRLLGDGVSTTVCRKSWRSRGLGLRRGPRPGGEAGSGWRSSGWQCASASGRARRSTADKTMKRGQGEAPGRGRKVGGEGKRLAHRGRRIGVEMPAGVRSSDDKSRQPGGVK
jgi:hypothetical protein